MASHQDTRPPVHQQPTTGKDPHLGWWREREALRRKIDGKPFEHVDDLVRQSYELDERIAATAPATLEGAAIVAAVLLSWYEMEGNTLHDLDQDAGATLARYFLAGLPADVKQRAGLEER
jgi:hypothetical protein